MQPMLKRALIISSKNAVNALLTNSVLMTMLHQWHSLNTRSEWAQIGEVALSCVLAREGIIWLPKILAWSQSATNGEAKSASAGQ